jgi:transcription-repair coupling factor (superfamily II helicase)
MRDMAEELLKLYAERKLAEGIAFSRDSNWQREFEDAFEFTETKDQLTAAQEVKRDMESPQPMDRLLCGDVGFGKTEVAMRAAFKALGDGRQVAVLAPTVLYFSTTRPSGGASRSHARGDAQPLSRNPGRRRTWRTARSHCVGFFFLSKDIKVSRPVLIVDEEQRAGVPQERRQIKRTWTY